ncbi:MAG: DUF1330 domain-containing protein [Paracoccaceae bacterium]
MRHLAKTYLIAQIRGHDEEASEKCRALSESAVADYGGKILVRKPSPDQSEGDLSGLTVVIEFDDMNAARNFYESEAYAATRTVRDAVSKSDRLYLVEV